jgi:hypothetical protein
MSAVNLRFMYYNFDRIHQTLRVTPAMEAGVRIILELWKKLRGCWITGNNIDNFRNYVIKNVRYPLAACCQLKNRTFGCGFCFGCLS